MTDKTGDLHSQIEDIGRKIGNNADMHPSPTLSAEQLQAFERKHGITLPEDYRLFLQRVGNGVLGDNIYALFPLGQLPDVDWPLGKLSRPFPLSEAVNYEEEGYPEDEGEEPSTKDGLLYVCHVGAGIFWVLIVTGSERGNMWIENEFGYFPSMPRVRFLDWCHQWINRGWNDGLEDLLGLDETEEEY